MDFSLWNLMQDAVSVFSLSLSLSLSVFLFLNIKTLNSATVLTMRLID
jgi:hypothetical protein